jgi:hypothetical protein
MSWSSSKVTALPDYWTYFYLYVTDTTFCLLCNLFMRLQWLHYRPDQHPLRRHAIYLLMRLAQQSQTLPPSLFVTGVILPNSGDVRDPDDFGGFADIFKANHNGRAVVLKRPRLSRGSDGQKTWYKVISNA